MEEQFLPWFPKLKNVNHQTVAIKTKSGLETD
jgi:hypothetical protein